MIHKVKGFGIVNKAEVDVFLGEVFLPGESQGWGSLVGCRLWGRTGSDTTEAAAAAAAVVVVDFTGTMKST